MIDPSKPSYLAKIKQIFPKSTKGVEGNDKNCILAINLDSDRFTPEKIEALGEWIETNFNKCLVLITDSFYALSLQMFDPSLDEQKASLLATSKARQLVQAISEGFQLQKRCSFETVLCSVVHSYSDRDRYQKNIALLYEQESSFKSSVESFAKGFLQIKKIPITEKFLAMTCHYVLEELAILACLSQQGYKTLIYPGYLPLLIEIANGKHPKLIPQLQQLTYYEMTIESLDR